MMDDSVRSEYDETASTRREGSEAMSEDARRLYKVVRDRCHVRSAIYRLSNPSVKYWKNMRVCLDDRVPDKDKQATDWAEYDPRDDDDGSLFMFND